jgi:hypothetical protein
MSQQNARDEEGDENHRYCHKGETKDNCSPLAPLMAGEEHVDGRHPLVILAAQPGESALQLSVSIAAHRAYAPAVKSCRRRALPRS